MKTLWKMGIFSNINMVNRILFHQQYLPTRISVGAAARSSWPTGLGCGAQCCGMPRGAGHGSGSPAWRRFRHGRSLWCGAGTLRGGEEAGNGVGEMEMWMEEVRKKNSVFFFVFLLCCLRLWLMLVCCLFQSWDETWVLKMVFLKVWR